MLKLDRRELLILGSSSSALLWLSGCSGVAEGVVATAQDGLFTNRTLPQTLFLMGSYVDLANKCVSNGLTLTEEAYGLKTKKTNLVAQKVIEGAYQNLGHNFGNGMKNCVPDIEESARRAVVCADAMKKSESDVKKINNDPKLKEKLGASLVMFKSANFFQTRAVGGLALLARKMVGTSWHAEVQSLLQQREFALTLDTITSFPDRVRIWQKTYDTVEEIPKKVEVTLDDKVFVEKAGKNVSAFTTSQDKIVTSDKMMASTESPSAGGKSSGGILGGIGIPSGNPLGK